MATCAISRARQSFDRCVPGPESWGKRCVRNQRFVVNHSELPGETVPDTFSTASR